MRELGVFLFFFLENDLSNFDKVLKLMFFKAGQKRLQSIQNSVNSFTTADFLLHRMFTTNVYKLLLMQCVFIILFILTAMGNTKQRSNCSRPFTLTYCFRLAR